MPRRARRRTARVALHRPRPAEIPVPAGDRGTSRDVAVPAAAAADTQPGGGRPGRWKTLPAVATAHAHPC